MARWLIELAALYKSPPPAAIASINFSSSIAIAAGLLISVCCVIVILSTCSFCDIVHERVRDKASSSDGDSSPSLTSKQPFFMMTTKKTAMSAQAKGVTKEQGAAGQADAHEQGKLSPHVWQRAILMGERCKRPNFSGLILYDEKGNSLPRRFPM